MRKAAILPAGLALGALSALPAASQDTIRIGALTKNLSNEFFLTMIEGYEMAATDFGIPIVNLDELIPADAQGGIDIAAQVASNNVRAGEVAAQLVLGLIESGAEVAVIEGRPVAPFIESPVVVITQDNLPE